MNICFLNHKSISGKIICYYKDFGVIKIDKYPGAIPLELIEKLESEDGATVKLKPVTNEKEIRNAIQKRNTVYFFSKRTGELSGMGEIEDYSKETGIKVMSKDYSLEDFDCVSFYHP